jgi:endonuclease-3
VERSTFEPAGASAPPQQDSILGAALDRLAAVYGVPRPGPPDDPLSELIATILSQHTSDANSSRAFAALRERFGSWEAVQRAPVEEIAAAIRCGGLAEVKARTIKAVLDTLAAERGTLSLDFLRELPTDAARRYLTVFPGVGEKTAACVLLFALGRPVVPVDTHVHRVARRLGLVDRRATAAQTEAALERLAPPERAYAAHVLLITHGRRVCRAPTPRCSACVLRDLCPQISLGLPGPPRGWPGEPLSLPSASGGATRR